MLQETKLNKDEGPRLEKKLRSWNLHLQDPRGASGGLGIIWNTRKVILNIIKSRHSWISSKIKIIKSNLQFILINIYGLIQNSDKKVLWDEISSFINEYSNEIILLGGDFNSILNLVKKVGGLQKISPASIDFKNWVESNYLVDIPTNNGKFM